MSDTRSPWGKWARHGLCATTAITTFALVTGTAHAQAAPEDSAVGLGEIVVQARKVSENLQNVPVAVTVLSGSDLQSRSIQRVENLAQFTPGMSIKPGSSTSSALTVSLRGQVQTDVLVTLDPSVGTYVDGVYWARAYGLNGNFLDIDSVQVLKGPQGTLFGRNTTGGAILINSKNPELDEFSARVSVTYGRFNEFNATGVINVPLVSDKIGLRLAASRLTRDGYMTNAAPPTAVTAVSPSNTGVSRPSYQGSSTGLKFDNRDRWNLRGKLDIKPTDDLTIRFSGEYFHMDETGPSRELLLATSGFTASNTTYNLAGTGALFVGVTNGGPAPTSAANAAASTALGLSLLNAEIARLAGNANIVSSNEVPYSYAKTQTYGITAIQDTSFGQVQLITGYRKIDSYAGIDLEGSQYPIHFTQNEQSVKQVSAELQVTGKAFDNVLDFAGGIFGFHEHGSDQSISITVPALSASTSHFYGIIDNDSIGAYGQATWHITDQFSFTGGLRYSHDKKGLESRNNNYNRTTGLTTCSLFSAPAIAGPEIVGVPQCALSRSDSFDGWSYTAGLEYKPTENLMIYLKTAKGFRSGGQNLRAPSSAFLLPFKPEIAYSYEVGFKSELLDRRVRLNVAAYQTDVNDIQRSTLIAQPGSTGGASATVLGNAGKARFRGFEAEVQVAPVEGFQLGAFVAHVDPKYIRYSDLSGDRSFERFDTVTKWQWGAAADFTQQTGDVKIKLHADYSWTGATPSGTYFWAGNPATATTPAVINTQNAAVVAANTRPAQGLLGARASVSFHDDMYELAIFGRNITNNRAINSSLLVAPVGYVVGARTEPATYGVTATVNF